MPFKWKKEVHIKNGNIYPTGGNDVKDIYKMSNIVLQKCPESYYFS